MAARRTRTRFWEISRDEGATWTPVKSRVVWRLIGREAADDLQHHRALMVRTDDGTLVKRRDGFLELYLALCDMESAGEVVQLPDGRWRLA